MSGPIKPPAVAGLFYPAGAEACRAAVDGFLAAAPLPVTPKALIAPHAGYVYSGPIAGTAYATLAGRRDAIRRVVLLGPAHRVWVRGIATHSADRWATPLGLVPIDKDAQARIERLPGVHRQDDAFAREHSLEVHLPFLQRALGGFTLVPALVGDAEPEAVAAVLRALWGGPETLVVISSDLSHFLDDARARRMDGATAEAVEELCLDAITPERACGAHSIAGLLVEARRLGMRATTLDLGNSGAASGDLDRVVGYGAFGFEESAQARLCAADRRRLLDAAAAAIRHGIAHGRPPAADPDPDGLPRTVLARRASFVTLKLDGALRGCVGTLAPRCRLIEDVSANAFGAAFADPRFPPVTAPEADRLEIAISVLGTPCPIAADSEEALARALAPHADGLILCDGDRRGVFLPQVWEHLPEPAEFIRHLKGKAGLHPEHWPATMTGHRFTVEKFGPADIG